MTYPPPYPPPGPPNPPSPPLVRASMVIDPGCAQRMARAATSGSRRIALAVLLGALPGLVAGGFSYPRRRSAAADVELGERIAIAAGVGVVVFLVATGLVIALLAGVVRPRVARFYAATLPVGSPLQVDYFADRMVAFSAGGVARETPYAAIRSVRTTAASVVLSRGLGAGALPIEVVPPAALALLPGRHSQPALH